MIEAPWRKAGKGGSGAAAATWGGKACVPAVQVIDAFTMGSHLGRKDARGWPWFGLLMETVRNFYLRSSIEEAVGYALGWTEGVRERPVGAAGSLIPRDGGEEIRLGRDLPDGELETRVMMGSYYKGYVHGRRMPKAVIQSCLKGIREESGTAPEALAFAIGWMDAIRKQPLRDANYMIFYQAMPDEALFRSIPAYFMTLPEDVPA